MFRHALFIILLVTTMSANGAANLVVTPEHRIMLLNETLTFTVTANFSAQQSALDLNTLDDDFDVQSIEFEQYSHLINLQQSTSSTWTINAKPKRLGVLVLPPMTVNNATSIEMVIRVLEQSTDVAGNRPDVFIESVISPKEGFVKQPRLYSVSVYSAMEVGSPAVDITFPDTLVVKPLPVTSDENFFKAGRRYSVTTHNFLLLPQIDGEFSLPEPTFTGTIRERNKGSFGQLYTREDTLFIKGSPTIIDVTPAPQTFDNQWLPAKNLSLEARWQSEPNTITQGQPAMLELYVQAEGLESTSLPDLSLSLPESLRAYPDKPILDTKIENGILTSSKSILIALVPQQAGELFIPELQIPWFDTHAQQTRLATIPAQTLLVMSNDAESTQPSYVASSLLDNWFWPGTCVVLLAYSIFATLRPRKVGQSGHTDIEVVLPTVKPKKDPLKDLLAQIDGAPVISLFALLTDYFGQVFGQYKTLHQHALFTGNQNITQAVDALYQYHYGGVGELLPIRKQLKDALKQLDIEKKSNSTLHFFQKRNTFKE